ncbi:hypothetical protein BGZ70_010476 [Mortierella alpina]|uniref:Uncharacterized protein n=1 Tax=Mortierella alpina TaxID=64518 RepID=A0A9P6LYM6_MORAP|nr:hypothetical protein BGZ70_010476 [Mortierella alpina]
MAPPKKEKMPSMKELQDLLAVLDAEGSLAIGGGGDETESANLDELYEDSYFHAILHRNIQELSIAVAHTDSKQDTAEEKPVSSENQEEQQQETTRPSGTTTEFKVLQLSKECSWGDDHESLGSQLLVRSGYASVLSALTQSSASTAQSIFVAAGSPGIGKSCLAYYLAYKLFEAGHDVVVSDPMFTNALIDRQYSSCYSPHLEKHSAILQAITSAPSAAGSLTANKKTTWWICDDGFLPIKGTKCHVVVSSATSTVDKDIDVIRKKNKLPLPVQFQIPQWTLDEIKAGLLVSLGSVTSSGATPVAITKEQEAVLESLFSKYKGNPKKIFAWVKANWVSDGDSSQKTNKTKTKTKSKLKSKATKQ